MKLPQEFEHRMRLQLGADFEKFTASLDLSAPVSLRLNKKKWHYPWPQIERVDWCETGYYLESRPIFSSDPLWHAGAYYVQEASSMSIEKAFLQAKSELEGPLKVLDLCAAPGGKSTHLAGLLSENDLLVSNEVIRSRVNILLENLIKQGSSNTIITNADSAEFVKCGPVFDVVLVDAPCSGEGLFRKDPEAVNEWNPENVQTCTLRQRRILENCIRAVRTGGFIIYSTCTYNPDENHQQIDYLQTQGFELKSFKLHGASGAEWQFMPHLNKGEGFYIALLQKQYGDDMEVKVKRPFSFKTRKAEPGISDISLLNAELVADGKRLLKVPQHLLDFYHEHLAHLQAVHIGQELGYMNEKLFQVSEYLPFSLDLHVEAFPEKILEQEEALRYLAKNTLNWNDRSSKGYLLLKYKDTYIGLGKFAGNRINNLFPNDWKLRRMPAQNEYFGLSV